MASWPLVPSRKLKTGSTPKWFRNQFRCMRQTEFWAIVLRKSAAAKNACLANPAPLSLNARLADYQMRIRKVNSDDCPDCLGSPASVSQLFECPSYPTTLTTRDLWTSPCEAINFLQSTNSFSHLPVVSAPPRPQRRRRPPPEPSPTPSGSLFSPLSLPPSPFVSPLSPPLFSPPTHPQ